MPRNEPAQYTTIRPDTQVAFYYRLRTLRGLYLQDALKKTVGSMDIEALDRQLAAYVPTDCLKKVASLGLRAEVFFPVPCILEANPFLLGYYRLLFGLSQKEFYNKGPFGRFKVLEDKGVLASLKPELVPLCKSLIGTAEALVGGIEELSLAVVHDLQLLTMGPQLGGSANTKLGKEAAKEVYGLFAQILGPYIREAADRSIRVENDSGRSVMIEFLSDPDVRITEEMSSGTRKIVSIEVKGGADASNIHNCLGEAEKSHRKAKEGGFHELWTILRVNIGASVAQRESPTTSRFFHLDRIADTSSAEHREFRDLVAAVIGIRIRD